jgi:signal transduction histidine kinase
LLVAPWRQTRSRLFDLEVDAELGAIRDRLEVARIHRHRHDVVNAITAVEGAHMLLTRDTLQASERATLTELLGSGLGQLRELVLADRPEECTRLSAIATSMALEVGGQDQVDVDVAPGLQITGSPGEVSEILRRLLTHSRFRTGGRPMTIRARQRGDRIELWVDDRGPESADRQRQSRQADHPGHFNPGTRGGLQVAIRLARGQGGEVTLEARPGGGESIGVSWPVSRA